MSELTQRDLDWFHTANSNPPCGFYPFKDRFLRRFGTLVGYDAQRINHDCWNCCGTGEYCQGNPCHACGGDGIHHTTNHYLLRYELEGRIYHKPVHFFGDVPEELRKAGPVSEIEGKIRHGNVDARVADRAFRRLLIRHEPTTYYQLIIGRWRNRVLSFRYKLAWRLIRLRNKMDLFPAVPEDDVPF